MDHISSQLLRNSQSLLRINLMGIFILELDILNAFSASRAQSKAVFRGLELVGTHEILGEQIMHACDSRVGPAL